MANFKVKILNINAVLSKVQKVFTEDIYDSKLLENIKDFTILRVQAETRKGKSLPDDSTQKPLTQGTIRIREAVQKGKIKSDSDYYFKPDPTFFKPKKSNLTASGQMLDSLTGKITKSDGTIVVTPSGSRTGNNTDIKTNVALAKDLASRGRRFLGLDTTGVKRVRKLVLDEIRRFKRKRGL